MERTHKGIININLKNPTRIFLLEFIMAEQAKTISIKKPALPVENTKFENNNNKAPNLIIRYLMFFPADKKDQTIKYIPTAKIGANVK